MCASRFCLCVCGADRVGFCSKPCSGDTTWAWNSLRCFVDISHHRWARSCVSPRACTCVRCNCLCCAKRVCVCRLKLWFCWITRGSVPFERCCGDCEGFSLAPPSLTGRSRVATGTKYAIPMHCVCWLHCTPLNLNDLPASAVFVMIAPCAPGADLSWQNAQLHSYFVQIISDIKSHSVTHSQTASMRAAPRLHNACVWSSGVRGRITH